MSHLAPMQNGAGRYLRQLKRLTFNYCSKWGSNRGTVKFINDHVVKLALKHPEVAIYVRPRRYRHPRMVAEYLNGNSQIISLKNKKEEDIWHHVNVVFSSSGLKAEKLKKPWYTANPSIQGTWTPFLYK